MPEQDTRILRIKNVGMDRFTIADVTAQVIALTAALDKANRRLVEAGLPPVDLFEVAVELEVRRGLSREERVGG